MAGPEPPRAPVWQWHCLSGVRGNEARAQPALSVSHAVLAATSFRRSFQPVLAECQDLTMQQLMQRKQNQSEKPRDYADGLIVILSVGHMAVSSEPRRSAEHETDVGTAHRGDSGTHQHATETISAPT